jgi:hypothetical protein
MAASSVFALLTQRTRLSRYFWLGLSMVFAVIYGGLALQQAFASDYVVQDDARQHIFWMQRFLDPELFPNDLIADYFQAAAPIGYEWLYRSLAMLGLTPDLVSKILPFFLGLITVGYGYFLSLEIFPLPFGAFISAALLNQAIWGSDEISSATPRAFLYPLLIAFLFYMLRQARWRSALVLVLQAIFYPPIILISVGVLGAATRPVVKGAVAAIDALAGLRLGGSRDGPHSGVGTCTRATYRSLARSSVGPRRRRCRSFSQGDGTPFSVRHCLLVRWLSGAERHFSSAHLNSCDQLG